MIQMHTLPAALAAGAVPFRAGPSFCAMLVPANGAPRRPAPAAGPRKPVTRDEIAALFAHDLYAAA
ncbi:MAG TPA: hypothetical protein PKD10_12710 [Paracoccaceae bacterium]|nr:hypothetical protein [Paracoccaceae bacterium]HMO71802.1 hypothetical protein [Paracoccaceae bacterium]